MTTRRLPEESERRRQEIWALYATQEYSWADIGKIYGISRQHAQQIAAPESHKESELRFYQRHKHKALRYRRQRRKRLLKAGICTACGKGKPASGGQRCSRCIERYKELRQQRKVNP